MFPILIIFASAVLIIALAIGLRSARTADAPTAQPWPTTRRNDASETDW